MLKVQSKRLGDVTLLCLQGQIVTGKTSTLRDAVLSLSQSSIVVLDLARVNRVDAGGLGVLLELRAHSLSRDIEFRLTNLTNLVRKVFEIARLDSVFETSSAERFVAVHSRAAAVLQLAPCA